MEWILILYFNAYAELDFKFFDSEVECKHVLQLLIDNAPKKVPQRAQRNWVKDNYKCVPYEPYK